MKKLLVFFIIFCLVFTSIAVSSYGASTKVKVNVSLESIECVENNHVGNEWVYSCTVNKKSLDEGDDMDVETTSTGKITIVCTAEEEDKYPDTGSKTLTIPVKNLKAGQNKSYTAKVTVTENRGRYSGNTAVWEFTFKVERK